MSTPAASERPSEEASKEKQGDQRTPGYCHSAPRCHPVPKLREDRKRRAELLCPGRCDWGLCALLVSVC